MDLKKYYSDPKFNGSFAGQRTFYEAVKLKHPNVKKKQVQNYLKTDDAYTLHRPVRRPKKFRRVYTKGIAYLYQIDLIDMSHLSSENKSWKWIVNVIDTFSKKMWCFKTKNKTAKTIVSVLNSLLTTHRPKKIETDGLAN